MSSVRQPSPDAIRHADVLAFDSVDISHEDKVTVETLLREQLVEESSEQTLKQKHESGISSVMCATVPQNSIVTKYCKQIYYSTKWARCSHEDIGVNISE